MTGASFKRGADRETEIALLQEVFMPDTPTHPGVYIEDIPSGVHTINWVSTSVALFIGRTKQGPMKKPTHCLSYPHFASIFGTDSGLSELPHSVRLFFENGGTSCYVMRIGNRAKAAEVTLQSNAGGGTSDPQTSAGEPAEDVEAPAPGDYAAAYSVIDKEVDLFNLLILPKDVDHNAATTASLWGPASRFCQRRRGFLLMDSPISWKSVQDATNPTTGVNSLRVGLVKENSAVFYPRLLIDDNGLRKAVGASGAIAGLIARIDATRGVWKAPAGIDADLRGVIGLENLFSNQDNAVLNPRGINTLREFPTGIVNWGARTMAGDDHFGSVWKYIPVRRIALFIEESLFRGLKWVVFEPNDEPLWAKIRLSVGTFMNNLFRQGAFQGTSPEDAFFIKCDKETTTQNDINRDIVNIIVGFAPLKPAEFVIIKIQQFAGQVQA
jgi:phage tail sheath protein FI